MKWRVCKTVTEYHYFVVDAESEQEAMGIANGNYGLASMQMRRKMRHLYYSDPANIDSTDPRDMEIEVVNAVRIEV